MSTIDELLKPIQDRLEPALFHAPYIRDGRRVIQANNHPDLHPYMLSDNSMPVIADFIASAPTDQAKLIAALLAVDNWLQNLDAIEQVNPSSAGHCNSSAAGVANVIRRSVITALEG